MGSPADYVEKLENAIADIATEEWRFRRVFEKAMLRMEAGESSRYTSQFNWFRRRVRISLEQANMHLVDLEGMKYDTGMALVPVNLDDFDPDEELIVEQMIEPVIMQGNCLKKSGTAVLGRLEK